MAYIRLHLAEVITRWSLVIIRNRTALHIVFLRPGLYNVVSQAFTVAIGCCVIPNTTLLFIQHTVNQLGDRTSKILANPKIRSETLQYTEVD
ncbi:hypothetical protein QUA81_07075 [Microcoleus sp. F6_B4]